MPTNQKITNQAQQYFHLPIFNNWFYFFKSYWSIIHVVYSYRSSKYLMANAMLIINFNKNAIGKADQQSIWYFLDSSINFFIFKQLLVVNFYYILISLLTRWMLKIVEKTNRFIFITASSIKYQISNKKCTHPCYTRGLDSQICTYTFFSS